MNPKQVSNKLEAKSSLKGKKKMGCCGDKNHKVAATPKVIDTDCKCGTELTQLFKRASYALSWLGVEIDGELCEDCRNTAKFMDTQGCTWVENHIETVLNRIENNAKKLEAPFNRVIIRQFITTAIYKARKKVKAEES